MAALVLVVAILAGCAGPDRADVAAPDGRLADVPGFSPDVRAWADAPAGELRRILVGPGLDLSGRGSPRRLLALSGGGDGGAYGAGFLVGWSERGDRPEFALVTGVSAGALLAPYAFLGPAYDGALASLFTDLDRSDVFGVVPGGLLLGSSLTSNRPLRRLVEERVTADLLAAIAREHAAGRRLLVVTTHLDEKRPVLWNMGAIASAGGAAAERLFEKVLIASASIPAIFPPVFIEAEADGARFRELHVDGGTMLQVFGAPPAFLGKVDAPPPPPGSSVTMIVNNRLLPEPEVVEVATLAIARQSFSAVVLANTRFAVAGTYDFAVERGIDFRLTFIGEDFEADSAGPFDPAYLGALFAYGRARGRAGAFDPAPPLDRPE